MGFFSSDRSVMQYADGERATSTAPCGTVTDLLLIRQKFGTSNLPKSLHLTKVTLIHARTGAGEARRARRRCLSRSESERIARRLIFVPVP